MMDGAAEQRVDAFLERWVGSQGNERAIDRIHIMRFYCDPSKGDVIEFKGYAWALVGLFHRPSVKGSIGQDRAPQVRTEFITKVEF